MPYREANHQGIPGAENLGRARKKTGKTGAQKQIEGVGGI
jgi:hypothetical protein